MDEPTQVPVLDTAPPTIEQKPQEPTRTWTDAPNSANVRAMIDNHDWQITIRADSFKELSERIAWVNAWIDKHGNGKKAQVAPPAPKVAAPPAAPSVPPMPPTASAPAPATQTGPQIQTMTIERMETAPRADGKVDAKFYQAGHQYPDLTTAKTPEALAAMLAQTGQWMPQHFAAIAKFPVKFVVDWVNSEKLNKNGKPYKNIVSIKATA